MTDILQPNHRILIIDDNAAIHNDFRKILGRQQHDTGLSQAKAALFGREEVENQDIAFEIDSAHQGKQGYQMVRDSLERGQPYALAFVDMRMPPGWDGVETIEHIWKVDPDLQIVICTAYSDYTWSQILDRLGHSDRYLILKKPFDNVEVRQLASALTEKWLLRRKAQMRMDELEEVVQQRTSALEAEIDERRRAEAQLKHKDEQLRQKDRLESLGSLAGGVAHEFNNLLQAIQGYVGFAREVLPADSQVARDLDMAQQAARRAAQITSQLLNFSRRKAACKEPVQVNSLIEDFIRLLRPLLNQRIQVHCELDEQASIVHADPAMVEQVLMNLCLNARDAMPDGGMLRIQTEMIQLRKTDRIQGAALRPGHYIKLSVIDNGVGMSADVRGRVFDPFFTTKEIGKGTGLGLAVVYGLIEQHAGAIDVTSEAGEGTRVSVLIPVQPGVIDAEENEPQARPEEGEKELILVAEDDPVVRDVLVRILRSAAYRTLDVDNGADAVEVFRKRHAEIRLVMLDVVMPRLNGREAFQEIAELDPEARIVFCTGFDPESREAERLADHPHVRVLKKPFQRNSLLSIVRELLDDRHAGGAQAAGDRPLAGASISASQGACH